MFKQDRNRSACLGWLLMAGALWGVTFPSTSQTARAADSARPNILWITCEDMSPDMGCYGDKQAHTPHLDKLASEGARFSRAFTVCPVCAPSRSSLITGMYPTAIGTMHMRSKGVPPAEVRCFTEYLRAAGYYCTNNSKTDYNFDSPVTAWDESSPKAHWRGRAPAQPFFAVFNLTITHESQIRTPADEFTRKTAKLTAEERHDPAQAELPPYYPDTPETRNDWTRYYDLITTMDKQAQLILDQLQHDGLADRTIVFFFSDHGRGLPRAKRWVYDSGTHVPLIVRWPGKLDAGSVREELVSFVDFAPTTLALAGVAVPPYMQGQVFLGPKTAAKPREYVFAARDRMDETPDTIRSVRDKRYQYIRNFQPRKPYAQTIEYMEEMPTMQVWRQMNKEGTLKGPQKLFFAPEKPVEELYDTDKDPHEVNNLAIDPTDENKAIIERMRQVLDKWVKDTHDLGMIPEQVLLEKMRPGGVWSTTAPPLLSPSGGAFNGQLKIVMTDPTPGASIAYTTDPGPNAHWRLYAGPIKLEKPATIRAKACRLGFKDSPEVVAKYDVQPLSTGGGIGLEKP